MRRLLLLMGAVSGAYVGLSASLAVMLAKRTRRTAVADDPSAVGLPFRDFVFPSRRDGLRPVPMLHGWLIGTPAELGAASARDRRWVVLAHGDGTNRVDPHVGTLPLARRLHDAGYSVLMFDFRGCGASADDDFTMGWRERLDILGALDALVSLGADRSRIGIIGFSLGGVAAALACTTPNVAAAVVCEGVYAHFDTMLGQRLQARFSRFGLGRWLKPGMATFLQLFFGYRVERLSPADALAQSEVPVYLIHGRADEVVPLPHALAIARSLGIPQNEIDAGDSDRLWLPADVGHVKAFRNDPDGYMRRVGRFLEGRLGAATTAAVAPEPAGSAGHHDDAADADPSAS